MCGLVEIRATPFLLYNYSPIVFFDCTQSHYYYQVFVIFIPQQIAMDIKKQKQRIINQVEDIEDAYMLRQIEQLLDTNLLQEPVVAYNTKGDPMTKKDLVTSVLAAKERVKNGKYTTQEDLEKEAESW